jgi:hypothetical protein
MKLLSAMMVLWSGWSVSDSHAMPVGFNQSWFHNDYGSQYLDSRFDRKEVDRIFDLSSQAGSDQVRLWFFESADFPMLEWKKGKLIGIKPDYIKNVIETLRIARSRQQRVYMTFLDAHAYRPDLLSFEQLLRLRSIYSARGGAAFLRNAIGPLLSAIQDAGLSDVVSRIDISNEMDAVIKRFGFNGDWRGASRMLCQWRSFIHGYSTFSSTPVTFSIRLHPLVELPANLLEDRGPMACADFIDFHSYHDDGRILRCHQLRDFASKGKKQLVLGEFGQSYFNLSYDNVLQARLTENYIRNAESCGFREALAWRLSDVRPGYNKEARYSHEAHGGLRPAFRVIQKYNSSH